jgi:hypothetical protein
MSDLAQWVIVPPPARPRERSPAPALPGYPQSRLLRQAHALWLQARGEREMPDWRGLAPLLPAAMRPVTILFAAVREPFDFRYAEIGSRVREISNADHTGRLLSELPHQRPPSRVWDHLSAALDARAPIRGVLPYVGRSRDISSICHIVLPLADDGERVDRLLVCVDLGPVVRLEDGTHPFTQLGTSLG